jgi:hypothetical protein
MNNNKKQSTKQDQKNQHQLHPQHQLHQQQETRREQSFENQSQNPSLLRGNLTYQEHEHPESRMTD